MVTHTRGVVVYIRRLQRWIAYLLMSPTMRLEGKRGIGSVGNVSGGKERKKLPRRENGDWLLAERGIERAYRI